MGIKITLPGKYRIIHRDDIRSGDFSCSKGGIYQLMDLRKKVIYVGQTNNLKRRLREHLRGNDRSFLFYKQLVFIKYYLVDNPFEREMYETYLINTLRPKYNVSKVFNSEDDRQFKLEYEIEEQEYHFIELREVKRSLLYSDNDEEYSYIEAFDYEVYSDEQDDNHAMYELGDLLYKAQRLREINAEINAVKSRITYLRSCL